MAAWEHPASTLAQLLHRWAEQLDRNVERQTLQREIAFATRDLAILHQTLGQQMVAATKSSTPDVVDAVRDTAHDLIQRILSLESEQDTRHQRLDALVRHHPPAPDPNISHGEPPEWIDPLR